MRESFRPTSMHAPAARTSAQGGGAFSSAFPRTADAPGTVMAAPPQPHHELHDTAPASALPAARDPAHSTLPDRGQQPSLTAAGLRAGLEALSAALARRNPGRRFFFEASPGHERADAIRRGEVVRPLASPQDPHTPIVDRNRLRASWATDVAYEDAVDQRPKD